MKKQLYVVSLFCLSAFFIRPSVGRVLNQYERAKVQDKDFEAEVQKQIRNHQEQAMQYQGSRPVNSKSIAQLKKFLAYRKGLINDSSTLVCLNKQDVALAREILYRIKQNNSSRPVTRGISLGEYNKKSKKSVDYYLLK